MSSRDGRLPFKASTTASTKTKKSVSGGVVNTHVNKSLSKLTSMYCNNSGNAKRNRESEIKREVESLRVCDSCHLLLTTSREYIKCRRELLTNARLLFLDDVQHHHRGVEAWERILQALDAEHAPS